MNRLRLLATITALTASQIIAAQAAPSPSTPAYCTWNKTQVALGESIWVEDPVLKASGASRDWQGFRLVCAPLFEASNLNKQVRVGEGLQQVGVGWVLGQYSNDFFQVVEGKTASQLEQSK